MGTSNMRDRLSREGAPAQGRRDSRNQPSGGFLRMLRTDAVVQQRPSRGGLAGMMLGQGGAPRATSGFPTAARGAAGLAAEIAARAGQSAASATGAASSMLAQRMSDVSSRIAEQHGDEAGRWSTGRFDDRSARGSSFGGGRMWDPSRQSWESSGHPMQTGRGWSERGQQRSDRGPWAERGQRQWGGRSSWGEGGRRPGMSRGRHQGDIGISPTGSEGWDQRGQQPGGRRGWRRGQGFGGQGSGRPGFGGPGMPFGGDQGRGRPGRRGRTSTGEAPIDAQQVWRRDRPDGAAFDAMRDQAGRVLPKRHQKRISKARGMADESAQRAHEASEHATRHAHSRRAAKNEQRAVTQADRAQRMLEQHLMRADRHMASTRRRRRRGMGLMMLAGAGAGATVAARRFMGPQQGIGGRQPGMDRDQQQPGARTGMGPGATYPGGERITETTRTTVTAPAPVNDRPGSSGMGTDQRTGDSSSTRRF
jgi:hypothetical protein